MILFWTFNLIALATTNSLLRADLKTTITKYQFDLYRLRDKLREAAMLHQIKHEDWVFLYLDSSIAKTIEMLDQITIWHITVVMLTFEEDQRFIRAREHLHRELSKPGKRFLAEIYNEYFDT